MRGLQKHLGPFLILPFVVRKKLKVEVSQKASKGGRLGKHCARQQLGRSLGGGGEYI